MEPLYLRAENGQIPELKRVILASGDRIVMQETLAQALQALFTGKTGEALTQVTTTSGGAEEVSPQATPQPVPTSSAAQTASDAELAGKSVAQLAQLASDHYEAAQQALRDGDWTTYGAELDKMQAVLTVLVEQTRGQ